MEPPYEDKQFLNLPTFFHQAMSIVMSHDLLFSVDILSKGLCK